MGGPRPDWWHLTALVTGPSVDAISDITDTRDELQWEASSDDRSALVSVRYLAQSATLQGVLVQGRAALRRAFGDTVTGIEPTALLREEDGAVYDPDEIARRA